MANEALLLGWLGNWNDVAAAPNGRFPTTLTVPRLLTLAPNGRAFLTRPHPRLDQLHVGLAWGSDLIISWL
jgi:sucrose-6-phosphate hydrolase SacC (GH32 family)